MIQKTNGRHSKTAISQQRQTANDGLEAWGRWVGRRNYTLEVVQHPLRARMCGFGDKDRRPLAPAAVAKMVVRREDGSIVDVDDVDYTFFLATVDLWSADGKHEMNLVLHPSAADRYVPTHTSKPRRRGGSTSGPQPRSGHQSPSHSGSTPTPSHYRTSGEGQQGIAPIMPTGYNQSYPFPPPEPISFQASNPYGPPPDPNPNWGYPPPPPPMERSGYPPAVLPSIQSFGRSGSPPDPSNSRSSPPREWHEGHMRGESEPTTYRAWPVESPYTAMDSAPFSSHGSDPNLRAAPSLRHASAAPIPSPGSEGSSWSQPPPPPPVDSPTTSRSNQDSYPPMPPHSGFDYAAAAYAQHSQYYSGYPQSQSSPDTPTPPISSATSPTRQNYTRTLVGPLSANACRLLDEHRKPGIFFLFQDLSVRTEGTFRLRLRLMNIGAPPAPEPGAIRVNTDSSPILSEVFTEAFIVYSAKRFPGVPDTTALSIALGNQGQKLPLRNRHGSSKQGRKRGGCSEDDMSDGA